MRKHSYFVHSIKFINILVSALLRIFSLFELKMDNLHQKQYKNNSKNVEDIKANRNKVIVDIRKSKREDTIQKKRNICIDDGTDENNNFPFAIDATNVHKLVQNSKSLEPQIKLEAIKTIRKLLSSNANPPIEHLIASGILPILVDCLTCSNTPVLQLEAAWALTNIASGASEHWYWHPIPRQKFAHASPVKVKTKTRNGVEKHCI